MGRGKSELIYHSSNNSGRSDLVDAVGKTGNLAGSVVLVKNALCASLVDCSLCSDQCSCSCLFVACLNSLVNFLDRGLDGRLNSLVCSGSLSACKNSLLGRFNVCHSTYLHVMYINV